MTCFVDFASIEKNLQEKIELSQQASSKMEQQVTTCILEVSRQVFCPGVVYSTSINHTMML